MVGDYLLFVFLVAFGVMQLVAAVKGLAGLSLFRRPYLGTAFGVLLVVAGYAWFFSQNRNIPDTTEGLSGPYLFGYFVAALAMAIAATLVISSLVKLRWRGPGQQEEEAQGLDALRGMTYLQAWARRWRGLRGRR